MRIHRFGWLAAFALVVAASVLGACSQTTPPPAGCGTFGAYVDAFPTPVDSLTSAFPSIDDDFLEVAFTGGFGFPFYGDTYDAVFLNTNGGMTFGGGTSSYDVAALDVILPGIAVFWGDMDAGEYGGETRANQMRWRQSPACFEVAYAGFQDNDDEAWNNTATVTLHDDGKIVVAYGSVLSEDILVGVFDGSHDDDSYPALGASYDLSAAGSGVILFDYWDLGPDHAGELSGQTITYLP